MKKLVFVFIALLLVMLGCKKDNSNYPPPAIKFITQDGFVSSDTMVKLGDQFKIGIDASNPDVNLTNFIINVETEEFETYLDSGMNTPTLHYEKFLVKGIADNERWTFIIRDRDGMSSEVSLNIKMDTSSVYGPVVYYENIELGAQNNPKASFYSLNYNARYNLSEAYQTQGSVDLCYYYDFIDTDENTIASPGANIDESVFPGNQGITNWAIHRTTRFKPVDITHDEFLEAQNDSLLIASYGSAEGKRKAKNLAAGMVFAFKDDDGTIGLFHVNSISGTDEGEVNISIKVQVK